MKKILSILCALSILMSVLIIPSAFSTSATETETETSAATALVPSAVYNVTESTDEAGTYTSDVYGACSMTFDYAIESGYNYILTYDYIGKSGTPSYGQPVSASTIASSTESVGSKVSTAITVGVPNSMYEWTTGNTVLLNGDDLLKSGGTYLALSWVYIEFNDAEKEAGAGTVGFKNMSIEKVAEETEYLYPQGLDNDIRSTVADGEAVYTGYRNGGYYSTASITFDYAIEAGYTYYLIFDYMGHNYHDSQLPSASTVATPLTNINAKVSTAVSLGITSSKEAYTTISCVLSGDDLLASGGTYLAISWHNLVSDPNFKNFRIAKEKTGEYVHPSYLHNVSKSISNGEVIYESGTWNAGSITFDYQIEADSTYLVTFDYKGKNTAYTSNPAASTVATATTHLNNAAAYPVYVNLPNSTSVFAKASLILDGNQLLASGNTYLIFNWVHFTSVSTFKNFKIAKVNISDTTVPTSLKNNEMMFGSESDRLYWYCEVPSESYKNPTFSTDYVIEAGKKYAVTFDYKYTGGMAGGMWFGATDTTATSNEGLIDKVQEITLNTAEDWTAGLIIFDTTSATDIITDTNKYFAFRASASWGAPKLYFSNLKITEITADGVLPVSTDKFTLSIENGEVIANYSATTGEGQYDTVGFTTDFELESDKKYVLAFNYKFTDADGGETCWFNDPFRAISAGSAFDDARLRGGALKDLFNNEAVSAEWTEKVTAISAGTVDETNKYLGFAAMAAPNKNYELSVKNIKVYDIGDVDFNNTVDTSDMVTLKKVLLGAEATGAKYTNVNAGDDEATNVVDLVAMKKILLAKGAIE